uniref:Aspartate/glutamate/uridylate kinase domain-containing protein n=1 Tax=Hemiselmis tepida TaxID=464990 RepID=A0A7S0WFX7_9CRYP|mmetsp:Transcript_5382/g.13789  ORF Transcript_5382/g.13789 Transcript_5382/m.13789 type:complete len:413 (+) Transcript_5382:33-1271(+)
MLRPQSLQSSRAMARILSRQLSTKNGMDLNTPVPRQSIANANKVVIKVGTAVVAKGDGRLALARMGGLVEEITSLKRSGKEVMLVSSGAIGVGRWRTGMAKDDVRDTPENSIDRQVCAATGQEVLMSTYDMMFQRMGMKCAQVLITQNDFVNQNRFFALTDTISRIAKLGIIPIINENDVVTGSHFGDSPRVFSDNDTLAALLASGTDSDGLALFTDVEGVFDKPPDQPGAKRIGVWDDKHAVEIGAASGMGRGGMASKIAAASLAANGGVNTVVASGYDVRNVQRVFHGEDVGTLFEAKERPTKSQRWLSFFMDAAGEVTISQAAHDRLLGCPDAKLTLDDVINVDGHFSALEPVRLLDHTGQEFGMGVTHLGADEIGTTLEASEEAIGEELHKMDLMKRGEMYVGDDKLS